MIQVGDVTLEEGGLNAVRRDFCGSVDLPRMVALVREFPAGNVHVADLPYRLSSWAFDDPGNVALWVDGHERLRAWAVMQSPFWSIDYALHPAAGPALRREVLAWAGARARELLGTAHARPAWFVHIFAHDHTGRHDLEEAGFADQADAGQDSWSKVLMHRSAADAIPGWPVPPEYTLRPLAGEGEVDAYVSLHRAVFGSANMTHGWRARALRQPEYVADLDLVAVAPDGSLAAFCIAWLDPSTGRAVSGQIEPLGVHPDHRQVGLGRAMVAESMRRLLRHGAQHVYVETDNYRDAALAMYESSGFRTLHEIRVYRKDYA